MRHLVVSLVLLASSSAPARADKMVDPDTEIAHRYFDEGSAFYDRHDYPHALERFLAAKRVKPLPAFDYNIARCYDRMDRPTDAIAEYRLYLATNPPDADEVRARVTQLEARVAAAAPPTTTMPTTPPAPATVTPAPAPTIVAAPSSSRSRWLAPSLVGGAALAVAIVGTALVASVSPDLDALDAQWTRAPSPSLQSQAHDLAARADAGYALWAAAGAIAIVDVVLFAIAARHRDSSRIAVGERGMLSVRF